MLLSSAVLNCSNSRKRKVVNIPDKPPVCSLAYVGKNFYIELNVVIFFFPLYLAALRSATNSNFLEENICNTTCLCHFFFICYMVSFNLILCICKSYWYTQCLEL